MSDRDREDLPKGIGEHVINAVWVLGGSKSSGSNLSADAVLISSGYDHFRDSLSEPKGIEIVKNKVLGAIGEVFDVEEILHGVSDEGVKTITCCLNGSQGAEHGNGAKGEVILLLSEVSVKGEGVGWVKDNGGP